MTRISDLVSRLARDAEAVCRACLPKGKRNGHYWHCGNVQGEPGQSLYVHLSGTRAGKWMDGATGEYGDLLDLIAANRGLDFAGAVQEAETILAMPVHPIQRREHSPRTPAQTMVCARRLFAASMPIAGTLAEAYLHSRGLVVPSHCTALRFHPRCIYRSASGQEAWPALIAAVTDAAGNITGVHRTWLDPAGGKAPLDQPRRALGHLLGSGVRFGAAQGILTATEGLETALAIKTALPGMPVIAALSSAHLAALIPPPDVQRLYIAHDDDDAGRMALGSLRERLPSASLDLHALVPRTEDFNADLLTLGVERFRSWLLGQLVKGDTRRFLAPPRDSAT